MARNATGSSPVGPPHSTHERSPRSPAETRHVRLEPRRWQVEAVTAVLVRAGVEPLPPITPVLCFIEGDWPMIAPPDSYRDVRREGPKSLSKILSPGGPLDPSLVDRTARLLAASLPGK